MTFLIDILIYSFLPLGMWVSFRLMRYPDLAIEQVFVLGGVITVLVLNNDIPMLLVPLILLGMAISIGTISSILRFRFKINAVILSLILLYLFYSFSLTIMGSPNLNFIKFGSIESVNLLLYLFLTILSIFIILMLFFKSNYGKRVIASGANPELGGKLKFNKVGYSTIGLSIANYIVMLGGMFYTLKLKSADISYGEGLLLMTIFIVIFTKFFQKRFKVFKNFVFIIITTTLYMMLLQVVVMMNIPTNFLRGVYALLLLVLVALLPKEEINLFK